MSYFHLGASADAETGSRASTEPASSLGPAGFDPARLQSSREMQVRVRKALANPGSVLPRDQGEDGELAWNESFENWQTRAVIKIVSRLTRGH